MFVYESINIGYRIMMLSDSSNKKCNTSQKQLYLHHSILMTGGPGTSVGIATDYGLDGPGIESRWGRDFPPVQTGPGAQPASCTVGTGSFTGVICGQGMTMTTHPLLVLPSQKSRAVPLPTLWATPGL
jgi:hypothetical protein